MSKFKIRRRLNNRLNTTKLKVFKNAKYAAGNSSILMEKVGQFLDIGSTVPEKQQSTLLTQLKTMLAKITAVSS